MDEYALNFWTLEHVKGFFGEDSNALKEKRSKSEKKDSWLTGLFDKRPEDQTGTQKIATRWRTCSRVAI